MNRHPVESSNIQAIGYDPDTLILEVEFGKNVDAGYPHNRLYQYFNVPAEVHRALMDAHSHGEFLYKNVAYAFAYRFLGTLAELGK